MAQAGEMTVTVALRVETAVAALVAIRDVARKEGARGETTQDRLAAVGRLADEALAQAEVCEEPTGLSAEQVDAIERQWAEAAQKV